VFKRILLFVATNIAVIVLLSILAQLFGLDRQLGEGGLIGLLIIAGLFGFGGSFVSLMISRWIAKRATGARVIEQPDNRTEQWLVDSVTRHARQAGIPVPEIAIYDAPEPNAFATGPSKNKSLVAVSTGLMESMRANEVDAVIAHEITHVANGDMVTLALVQGVVNTFVIFLARVVAQIIHNALSDRGGGGLGFLGYMAAVIVLEIVFGILATPIVAYVSRWREYRADAGAARLSGRDNMIAALERLGGADDMENHLPDSMEAFGIFGGKGKGLRALFSTHPPIPERIRALQNV